ncbi:HAD-IC family P-type ATPase [Metaclostridioides mangenotii]|uniref:HAD-IC family P-type ATPase n=1 Tax=Metaclostridioides mangenotii TaxID=1540 RepID=UPI0005709D09|nr:HAD-IC family P-type ATPase [Clostridioides mangenotii]
MNQNINGLTSAEVEERIKRGESNLPIKPLTRSYKRIFTDNICTLFNLINIVIAAFIIYTRSYKNLLFLGVVVSNIFIGIIQEIRAKKSVDKLSLLNQAKASVVRNGEEIKINQQDLVKDDVILVRRGGQLCVDGTVIETNGLEVDESQLTGESDPVYRYVDSDVMSGSFVISGLAYIKVTNVGVQSHASKIAMEAKKSKDINSELIRTLKIIIKMLTLAIIPIGILLFMSKFATGVDKTQAILGTAAAVIGMIPEGLILITSIALAVGVINLTRKKVLVKTMGSIENLARVDLLCLDKTGTITDGKIKVVDIVSFSDNHDEDLEKAISTLVFSLDDDNATSLALKSVLTEPNDWMTISKVPFSSERKWSGVTFESQGSYVMGAPEYIFKSIPKEIQDRIDRSTGRGERVLAFAHSENHISDNELPEDLKLLGIAIMEDTIRPEAKATLSYFKDQGVSVRIISGDNAKTVSQIASRAGVDGAQQYIDMSNVSDDEDLIKFTEMYKVFGRVSPEQKKKLVKAFKDQGYTVGMTGDGVNDILALKEANCSIAMAEGSDAAKGVSDFVLLDSNFDSMVGVVMEGRRVVNNIQQVASQYLMKTVYSTILATLFIFINSAYPFHPIQLMPITALGVGIPSFFLALRPNYSQIKAGFLVNVLIPAFSSGISVVVYILTIMVLGSFFELSFGMKSTLCVVLTGAVCFTSLVRISKPINKKIGTMLVILISTFVVLIVFFRGIFSLENVLSIRMLMIAVPLLLSVIPVYNFIRMMITFTIKKYIAIKYKFKYKVQA